MSVRASVYQAKELDSRILSQIRSRAQKELFQKEGYSGFLIEKSNASSIVGRYVERLPISEIVTDPFGVETSFERFEYKVLKFELTTKPPRLVVFSPFSLVRTLVGRLSEFSNFSFSLSPSSFLLTNILEVFSKEFPNFRAYAACVDNHMISSSTAAKMFFESSEDVRPHISKFLRARGVKFSSVKMEFEALGKMRRCEIKESGTITIFGESDSSLTQKIISIVQSELSVD